MEFIKLHQDTRIGYVHLRVCSLKKELGFYKELLGFHEVKRYGNHIYLSANRMKPYHIILTEDRSANPRKPFTTGLFHLAIRVPNRRELAAMFLRLYENKYTFQGFADHGVSEALYMADPEGNGVEIYFDRPRGQWPMKNGRLEMVTDPLDINDLVKVFRDEKYEWKGIHPGTDIGHIHLQVSKLSFVEKFYFDILGMDITQDTYPGALFLSAGGYHHHIGTNVWAGEGAAPPNPNTRGLAGFGIHIPDQNNREILIQRMSENHIKMEQSDNRLFVEDYDHNIIELIFD